MPRVISDAVRALATESGELQCHVDILDANGTERILSTKNSPGRPATLKVVGGEITTDSARSIPGQGSIDLLVTADNADDLIPRVARHPLSPVAGTFVQISYSAPGDPEELHTPYGRYEIANLKLERGDGGIKMSADLYDGARRIERARFVAPRNIGKGTPYAAAFENLISHVLPQVELHVTPTVRKTGSLSWDIQDDRLAAVLELCAAIGYRLSFDGTGNVVIAPDPDEMDDPIWTFVDGGDCTITRAARTLSDEKAYNGVIAMGESTGSDKPPVRGEAWDTNPNSPTYFDPANPDASTYGPVPFFYVSEMITTTKQAVDAARARLPKVMGLTERLRIEAVPNPGVQDGDPLQAEQPEIGAAGTFVAEVVTMPLRASQGRMVIDCRERRILR